MKLLAIGAVVLFVGWMLTNSPDILANATETFLAGAWELTVDVFAGVRDFLRAVLA